jgi:hypothetical protein
MQSGDPAALKFLLGEVARHTQGDPNPYANTIVPSKTSMPVDWVKGDTVVLMPSGLWEIPLKTGSFGSEITWEKSSGDLKRADFLKLFENSVFPTPAVVDRILKKNGVLGDISWDDYTSNPKKYNLIATLPEDIATRFPGVHYHMSCRAVDKDCSYHAALARSVSGIATGRTQAGMTADLVKHIYISFMNGDKDEAVKEAEKLSYENFRTAFDKIIEYKKVERPSATPDEILADLRPFVREIAIQAKYSELGPEKYVRELVETSQAFYRSALGYNPKLANLVARQDLFELLARIRDKPPPPPLTAEQMQAAQSAGRRKRRTARRRKSRRALGPAKYYRGLSTRRKSQRHREITRRAKMSWKDPKAYKPFATDKGTQRRPSSYSSRFHTKYPGVTGLPAIAKATHVPLSTLHTVYNRGMAAWRTGHRPGASQAAWGMARVHSFVLHGKTWRTADKDLAGK